MAANPTADYRRLECLGLLADEFTNGVTIVKVKDGYEVSIGRIAVFGQSVREALDEALRITKGVPTSQTTISGDTI